ncbi:MAG TPA: hypothetical protein VHX15_02620 [Frankiaceae bacterium]|nr:hypothetical protein [Frankiaceae bacterium]
MPVAQPGPESRWRCGACGNLTRFDVVRTLRSREFVHVTLAGEQEVQEREVVSETIERVTCRWCAAVDSVVLEPRPDHPEQLSAVDRAAAVPDGES